MKKIVLILLLIINTLILTAQSRTTISGVIKDPQINTVTIKPIVNYPLPYYASGVVNEKGEYNIELNINTPTLCEIVYSAGRQRVNGIWIYIDADKKIEVNYSEKKFSFGKDHAKENDVLKSLRYKIFDNFFKNSSKYLTDILKSNIRDTLQQLNCSSKYAQLLNDVIEFESIKKEMKTLKNEADIDTYKSFMTSLLEKGLKSPTICSVSDWIIMLDEFFVECENLQLLPPTDIRYENRLKWIDDSTVKSMYGVFLIDGEINRKTWLKESINPMIDGLSKYITTDNGKKELSNALQRFAVFEAKYANLQKGKAAPKFIFENDEGKMVSLTDYRGKFVILDVWNIHCSPCIAQIPYIKSMEKELEEKGVVFISISADPQDEKDKWKAFVKKREMVGVQLIMDSGRKSKFMTDYVIQGFPTFVLINPEGEIIDSHFDVPASQSFKPKLFKHIENYNWNS